MRAATRPSSLRTCWCSGTAQLIAAQDTYIRTTAPGLNYGNSTSLIVDRSGGSYGDQRALLQFDLSAIPAGATITSATLKMQATQNGGAFNINVYQVTQAWVEGSGNGTADAANWNERSPGTNWSTAGGSFNTTPVATLNTGAVGQHSWDLTTLVQSWFAGTTANNGILLGSQDLGTTTITYDSSEGATPPRLDINYVPPANVAPVITSNGGGATAAVNVAENTTAVTTVTATDADLPAQTLTYSISGGADAAKFTHQRCHGRFELRRGPELRGTHGRRGEQCLRRDGASQRRFARPTRRPRRDRHGRQRQQPGHHVQRRRAHHCRSASPRTPPPSPPSPPPTPTCRRRSLTYSISGGADAAKFSINSSTGVLSFVAAPNYEAPTDAGANNVYDVTVQVSDGTLTDTQALAVAVTDVSNVLVVTTTSDVTDGVVTSIEALNANKGADGFISLREAILAANNTAGADTIFLPAGTFTFALGGQK